MLAVLGSTKNIIFMEEGEVAVLSRDSFKVIDLEGKNCFQESDRNYLGYCPSAARRLKHLCLKRLTSKPKILERILSSRINSKPADFRSEQNIDEGKLKEIKNIFIVACGTAFHAGLVGKYVFESLCSFTCQHRCFMEFRYRDPLVNSDTLVIAISQSGETADTLAGVREARKRGSKVLSICNVLGSTLTRESDGIIYTHAGPEIGVASTKAYTAQLAAIYLFAFYLARIRRSLSEVVLGKNLDSLCKLPHLMAHILKEQSLIANLSRRHSHFGSFLYLGRNINFPSALEGALKLKEISYIPAEGYAAGEMKHGPIALIDEYRAVVCIAPYSKVYEKMVSNIQEIRSRKGKIIAIASKGDKEIKESIKMLSISPSAKNYFLLFSSASAAAHGLSLLL